MWLTPNYQTDAQAIVFAQIGFSHPTGTGADRTGTSGNSENRYLPRSRRFSSASTASRIKSVLSSSGRSTARMRANVPFGSAAIIFSGQSIFRPMRGRVSHMGFCGKLSIFRICLIDTDKAYALNSAYAFQEQVNVRRRDR